MAHPITFRIGRGIGQYDFNDYYAVLGLPLTADASQVRKRYLLVAKCLHPDIHGRTHEEKQVATQYLSKLVNPAYNVLSQERERSEYAAILRLLGKRLMKRNQKFHPHSDLAVQYLSSAQSVNYEQTIQEIAKQQYQDLNQALDNICLLSELNLAHILLLEGYRHTTPEVISIPKQSSSSAFNSSNNVQGSLARDASNGNGAAKVNSFSANTSSYQMRSESKASPSNPVNNNQADRDSKTSASIDQYILQAEKFIGQQLWASALKELRAAIQIDCKSSKCHALLGIVYLNQKLAGMAKVSFQQALKLNPQEALALQYISQVDGTSSNKDQPPKKDGKEKKGGFFGWLGGG
ncbi:DnaJ domain-containing protein [Pseudanabaena biceps]|nr:DnaJ domain-containing protein [Pseudanabaena biceps]